MIKNYLQLLRLYALGFLFVVSAPAFSQAILTKVGSSFPLFNGADLSAWTQTGNANWQVVNKEPTVTQGSGMLVSKFSAPDLLLEFDYWVSDDAKATIYFRCTNPSAINPDTAYEVILVNQANGVGAGSIRSLSKAQFNQVANQWNHIQISAIGNKLSVTLNGVVNQVIDARFSAGPIAVNYQGGVLRLKNFNFTIPGRW